MDIKSYTVIITAMQEEADIIISKFNLQNKQSKKNIKVYEGTRQNNGLEENLLLVVAGIGKLQAAMATTFVLENYEVDKLVNIGIAGSLNSLDTKVGDVFLPNCFIQHDMYLPFDGEHLDYIKKPIFLDYAVGENYEFANFGLILSGICLTGDAFIDDEEKLAELHEKYSADIVEMEAFAILSVAREYGVLDKCVVIKAISDGADNESREAHMNNLEFAMQNSVEVLELIL